MNIGVSIILATYNRAHLILDTLTSIQNQIYKDWECLIIDDGGTDSTFKILQPLLFSDSRFSYQKRPDAYLKGLPGCRNYGLDLAKGDFVIFFDDDDIVHPQNLELVLEGINLNSSDFCLYRKKSFSENKEFIFEKELLLPGHYIDQSDLEKIITNSLPMASCTVLWRSMSIKGQRFNEQLLYAEEWEFYTRLIANGLKGFAINNILYFNRKHLQSNTGEFYRNNPVRVTSHVDAVILVIKNLKEEELLTNELIHYFTSLSLGFKRYDLFNRILVLLDLGLLEKFKWKLFYMSYPLRLPIYKIKKKIKKITK